MEIVEDVILYSKTEMDDNGDIKTEDWVMLIGSRGGSSEIPISDIESGKISDYTLTEEAKNKLRIKLQNHQAQVGKPG
ncbi:MAG: hypothetical protein ACOC5L_00110 [Halobacteriota archaeon]